MLASARYLMFLTLALASFQLLAANPQVEFQTSRGNFIVELYPEKAPRTVENFLRYVNSNFYSGTVFHRTIHKFVVQGGGFTERLEPKDTMEPIPNESTNGLSNDIGTLAMARGYGSDTATSQFFINLDDNRFLNFYKPEPGLQGYTVFGRVVRGFAVLYKMSEVQTSQVGKLDHVPKEPPVILSAKIMQETVVAENIERPGPVPVTSKKSTPSKKGKKSG